MNHAVLFPRWGSCAVGWLCLHELYVNLSIITSITPGLLKLEVMALAIKPLMRWTQVNLCLICNCLLRIACYRHGDHNECIVSMSVHFLLVQCNLCFLFVFSVRLDDRWERQCCTAPAICAREREWFKIDELLLWKCQLTKLDECLHYTAIHAHAAHSHNATQKLAGAGSERGTKNMSFYFVSALAAFPITHDHANDVVRSCNVRRFEVRRERRGGQRS